ncbi:MAG: anaerobic ribonucleoside-triphosphate reductase activating protein [Methanophagales archaeon]|nr:anaerobic ribonucleoside-triphosphate reductase activating protein [Methanophagales archaeon]
MAEKINLGDIVHFSTIDWHGKAAMVIFLRCCPLRCIYCHNYKLLEAEPSNYVEIEEIESEIAKNEKFIDAVVLSGGEPFMQPHAIEAIASVAKKYSLAFAVQTNGFYPAVVKSILKQSIIDKVFLDIKAPLSDETLYEKVTRVSGVADRVKNTLMVCIHAKIDLELITTVFKSITGTDEVNQIAKEIEAAGAAYCPYIIPYIIQQGRTEHVVPDSDLRVAVKEDDVFSRTELKELAARAYHTANLKEVRIRTREGGEEVVYKRNLFV